jgi:hypothetical protein
LQSDAAPCGRFAGALTDQGIRVIAMSRFGYGTYASAEYTTGQIPGARFIGFERGGHTWVGHDAEARSEIVKLLHPSGRP